MSYAIERDWQTEAGFRAVVMLTDMGHRCGYVGVPKGHPLYGVGYSEETTALRPVAGDEPIGKRGIIPLLCAAGTGGLKASPEIVFDVHGGLTFASDGGERNYPVASDLWWFGYDCAHAGDGKEQAYIDAQPENLRRLYRNHDGDVVRTLGYCVDECESLARQFIERVVPRADDTYEIAP